MSNGSVHSIKETKMIEGRYEIKIHFDNNGKTFQKAIEMGQLFENASDFLRKILGDLQAATPMLDQYLSPEKKEEEEEDA
jgi:hypothetical protein